MKTASNKRIDSASARKIALRFLQTSRFDCENPDPNGPKLTAKHFEYAMPDGFVAYEFPLKEGKANRGYVMVSGDKTRHPILEYVMKGSSLRKTLESSAAKFARNRKFQKRKITWFYLGPLDIFAEIMTRESGYLYVRFPNVLEFPSRKKLLIKKRKSNSPKSIAARWRFYERATLPPSRALPCDKMFGVLPPIYNQTCQGSLKTMVKHSAKNYCTPQCIVGCVATGWATLAGAWESLLATGKIYSDAPDWRKPWESSWGQQPRPASAAVNRHMWHVHGFMGTDCQGNTNDNNTLLGSWIFSEYGVDWQWGFRHNIDYAFASSCNKAGQPYLLTAQSDWVGDGATDGHGVVVHGYNDADQHIYVTLGWGSSFPDKWIAFSSLSQASAYFVTKFKTAKSKDVSRSSKSIPAILKAEQSAN